MNKVNIFSPAKINLNLKILNFDHNFLKHKLKSQISILKLSDKIQISKSKYTSIHYKSSYKNILIKNDIIKRTIINFDKKYKTQSNFKILVTKNIPVGYGLGGGSSNAASILKFLYSYHSIHLNNFWNDAPIIGSDVLLFLDNYPKIIDGLKGFKNIKVQKPRWRKVFLIFPSKKNLTKDIFLEYKKNKHKNKKFRNDNDLVHASKSLNKEFKEIYEYLEKVKSECKLFGMSGSGSSIFLSFVSSGVQNSIITDIIEKYPSVRIEKSYYFS